MGTINVAELNFPWEKTASQFFGMMYDFTIAITKFAICDVRSDNLKPGLPQIFTWFTSRSSARTRKKRSYWELLSHQRQLLTNKDRQFCFSNKSQKLIPNLYQKEKYIIHYRKLKLCLTIVMILTKVNILLCIICLQISTCYEDECLQFLLSVKWFPEIDQKS